jgi:hypothetical protein
LEKANGNAAQNLQYCKKGGDFEEYGELVRQGQRTDLANAADVAVSHGLKRVAEEHPTAFVRYHKGLVALRDILSPDRDPEVAPWCELHVGRAGKGKTSSAFRAAKLHGAVWWHVAGAWFDGYDGHPSVIFDDMPSDIPFRLLLKVLDRYPMSVPIKGGFVKWRPTKIWLTSNLPVDQWYPTISQEELEALKRRITNTVYY